MRRDYASRIREPEPELAALERRMRGAGTGDRVKMLRLLKAGSFRSCRELARVLGYSERQIRRWWADYEAGGLSALLAYERGGGRQERVSGEAIEALRAAVSAGDVLLLKEAQAFLETQFGITYTSLQGVADMMRRHEVALRS